MNKKSYLYLCQPPDVTRKKRKRSQDVVRGWSILAAQAFPFQPRQTPQKRSHEHLSVRGLSCTQSCMPLILLRCTCTTCRGGRQEIGTMNHDIELGHVSVVSASRRQRSTHLDAEICGAKPCYLGVIAYGAEQRVQN
jgi:hypothetical protein